MNWIEENQKNKIELLFRDNRYLGWYFKGENPDVLDKLLSFSKVNSFFKPFNPIIEQWGDDQQNNISSIALPWLGVIKDREESLRKEYGFTIRDDRANYLKKMVKDLNQYSEFFERETSKTQELGNYTETVAWFIANGKTVEEVPTYFNGNSLVKSEIGNIMGTMMGNEIKKIMDTLEEPKIYSQVALASKNLRMMGLIDFLIVDKNKDFYIIDTKSGSQVKFAKLDSVIEQVIGNYSLFVEESFGRIPKGHYCVSGFFARKENDNYKRYYEIEAETIDLTKKINARRTKSNTREEVIKDFMKKIEIFKIAKKNKWI